MLPIIRVACICAKGNGKSSDTEPGLEREMVEIEICYASRRIADLELYRDDLYDKRHSDVSTGKKNERSRI